MSIHKLSVAGAGLALLLLTGCAQQPKQLYHWGDYENLLYIMYTEPGAADPDMQIQKLTADIQQAHAKDLRIAPGIHAHLGYMYALKGNMASAKAEFIKEKQLYPESAIFIDGMLQRMEKGMDS
ncbi:DUF4810 domain-containing protein [Methylophaga lonarensis]|uniref:DUF4810 domain-containing protein n=1 Tax=Methylophaga lonarensis TaxID=999151 RepID=UPI003D2D5391